MHWIELRTFKRKTFILNKYMNLFRALTMQFDRRFFYIPQEVHQTYTCTNPRFLMLDVVLYQCYAVCESYLCCHDGYDIFEKCDELILSTSNNVLITSTFQLIAFYSYKDPTTCNYYLSVTEYQTYFKQRKGDFCKSKKQTYKNYFIIFQEYFLCLFLKLSFIFVYIYVQSLKINHSRVGAYMYKFTTCG